MIAENEQRRREALLLLDFDLQELAELTQDELRVLAAIAYVPPPTAVGGREGGPLHPRHHQKLAELLAELHRPRTIARGQWRRRRAAIRPRQRGIP